MSENIFKKENLLYLEAMSPQDLDNTLKHIAEKKDIRQNLVCLDISDQGVLVSQFELPNLKNRELENTLKLEAVELLSLLPEQVEIDYQVTHRSENIKGVFAAISKNVLEQYIAFLNKANLIPLKVSALILNEVNDFYKKNLQRIKDKVCCMIVSSKDHVVNLAIFNKGDIELLREIHFIPFEEAESEAVETIRYYLGKHLGRKLDEIYLFTRPMNTDNLSKDLESEFDAKIIKEEIAGQTSRSTSLSGQGLFDINLVKKSSVSIPARKSILYAMNVAITALIIITGLQIYNFIKMDETLRQLKYSYNPEDYKYAMDLAAKKELLKNVK